MANYYYARGNQRFGPVSAQQLRQLAVQRKLSPNDRVLAEGTNEWVQAGTINALFATVTQQTSDDLLGFLNEATPVVSASRAARTRPPSAGDLRSRRTFPRISIRIRR